jgi:hypothetical protein
LFAEYQVVKMLLGIIYVLLMAVFVFVILYPFVREFCHEFFISKTAGEVAAISSTLMMLGYGFWMLYYFVEAFIGLLLILASLFSGLTLLYRARESYVDLVLFISSISLSAFSFVGGGILGFAMRLLGRGLGFGGVIEGTRVFILPTLRDSPSSNAGTSQAMTISALVVTLCGISMFAPLFLNWEPQLSAYITYSDVAFVAGGLVGLGLFRLRSKLRKTARSVHPS